MSDRKKTLTVGELRKKLDGVEDSLEVWAVSTAMSDGDLDQLYASAESTGIVEVDGGVRRFAIYADGLTSEQQAELREEYGDDEEAVDNKEVLA